VSGAPRLWTAGTRPYGPGCVLVRTTGAVHLVSTWDEGIPEEIPHENLFGITWNPSKLLTWLASIEGVADARCVGTDSLTPRFSTRLPKVFPAARLVDAEPALEEARRIKTTEEVDAIRAAISVAETALAAAVAALAPGITERRLAAVFMEAMARAGVTTPATQRVASITSDLVAFDAGVVANGYIGEVGRTWPIDRAVIDASTRELYRRADELWKHLLAALRPGTSGAELLAAYDTAGEPMPSVPIATGLGLGFDRPVITRHLPKTAAAEQLVPGMVVAVAVHVSDDRGRAVLRKEAALITEGGADVLTSSPHWQP
jgi:Xaa-Pro aminopeptidase